ncbi:MAG: transcription termination/antitermination protein NusG, partial [Microcystis panniformis]
MNLEEDQFPEELNLSGLPKKPRWYAVQVASGCEKRV